MVSINEAKFEIIKCEDGIEQLKFIERCARISYLSVSKLIDEYDSGAEGKKSAFIKASKIICEKYNRFGRDFMRDYPKCTKRDVIEAASALQFVEDVLIKEGATSMLEFGDITVLFECCIGFTRENNRHRHASRVEMSTRYADFSKIGDCSLQVVTPEWMLDEEGNPLEEFYIWKNAVEHSEKAYKQIFGIIKERINSDEGLRDADKKKELSRIAGKSRGVLPLDTRSPEVVKANLREWAEVILKLRASLRAHESMQEVMFPLLDQLRLRIPVIFDYKIKTIWEMETDIHTSDALPLQIEQEDK